MSLAPPRSPPVSERSRRGDAALRRREAEVDAALADIAILLNEARWAGPAEAAQQWARRLFLAGSCVESAAPSSWSTLERRFAPRLPPSLRDGLFAWHGHLPEAVAAQNVPPVLSELAPGELYELLLTRRLAAPSDHPDGRWGWVESGQRRQFGAHFTPALVADFAAERCLGPVLSERGPNELATIHVCDPAAGAGALLAAAARYLARWLRERCLENGLSIPSEPEALARVVSDCIWGIDVDPTAILLCSHALWTLCGSPPDLDPGRNLVAGDAVRPAGPRAELAMVDAFPATFDRPNPGFDAMLGNPPWVAYVGRACQPLEPELKREWTRSYGSFRRYRTLHGVFVERCASLLRLGGRLGLILPTSVADLAGYAPTRDAHDRVCRVDASLPDLGNGRFPGVFQPSMLLLSTRHDGLVAPGGGWPLARADVAAEELDLLSRLDALPKCPSSLFGERGYQTNSADRAALTPLQGDPSSGCVALLSGSEITEFRRHRPRWQVDPTRLSQRLRLPEQWCEVRVLIRQTARFPIAAPAAGEAFRNSVLAGFESAEVPWPLLLAYLNSSLARWFHYQKHRDARQGMPQLKVSHLRSLPRPPTMTSPAGVELEALGRELATRNAGIGPAQRAALDALVYRAFGLSNGEETIVQRWVDQNPLPRARAAARAIAD